MRKLHILMVLLLGLVAAILPASTVSADVIGMEVVSVDSAGNQGTAGSNQPAISADGRYVAFVSFASNLVPGDTNGTSDIFVHDRVTGTTERVSVGAGGTQSNGSSNQPDISADGRYVSFESDANNLIGADTNGETDIFVHDRDSGFTIRASLANGAGGAEGNGPSNEARISDNGQFVVFQTEATNLFPGDTNAESDIIMRDIINNTTEVVSVNNAGTQGNSFSGDARISGNGQFVGFTSAATNLVVGDTNGINDVFVRDVVSNTTERISVSSGGAQGNDLSSLPSLSFDGQYVAFTSNASNLVAGDTNLTTDVFVHNRSNGNTVRVSVSSTGTQGDGQSRFPDISSDGRYITFDSFATTLVANDTNSNLDIFLHDRMDGETERVSISVAGAEGDGNSGQPTIALENDRQLIAFNSTSTNLIANDTNGNQDIFVATMGIPGVAPTITSAAPPAGTVGTAYTHTYTATGDTPISYAVSSGALPDGLTLSGDTISGTPTMAGTFTGEVTATNADGTDTQAFSITISDMGSGELPVRLYPADGDTLTEANASDWPMFTFQHIDGIEWYQIWIGASDYTLPPNLFQWYPATDSSSGASPNTGICDTMTDICTIPMDIWLTDNSYVWWMTYWSPSQPDFNLYWNETFFSVDFAPPSGAFTLTSPADGTTVNSEPMTIEWDRDPAVHWYQVWVGPDDYSTSQYFAWTDATEVCDSMTCSIDVSSQTFADGDYEVWVEFWEPGGYVMWPAMPNATFTVDTTP